MKYTGTASNGETFTKNSKMVFTHAVVTINKKTNKIERISCCGSLDAALKRPLGPVDSGSPVSREIVEVVQ